MASAKNVISFNYRRSLYTKSCLLMIKKIIRHLYKQKQKCDKMYFHVIVVFTGHYLILFDDCAVPALIAIAIVQ